MIGLIAIKTCNRCATLKCSSPFKKNSVFVLKCCKIAASAYLVECVSNSLLGENAETGLWFQNLIN